MNISTLSINLAYLDLMARFRRSWVGGFWLIITPTIFIASVSVVYGALFGVGLRDYVPTLAIGYVCWSFLTGCVTEGPLALVESEAFIKNLPNTPVSTWMLRVIARQIITFASPFAVALVATAACGKISLSLVPLGIVGTIMLFAFGACAVVILSIIGTRYRDVQPMTGSVMQILLLVTPVMWSAKMLGSRQWVADLNPLSSILAVARDPWLGVLPSAKSYAIAGACLACTTAVAIWLHKKYRFRLAYWV